VENLVLTRGQLANLHHARAYHPSAEVRRRALCLLHLARGESVAEVSRACGWSRPTTYRVLRLWRSYGLVDLLDPAVARRVCPWRAADPPAPRRASSAGEGRGVVGSTGGEALTSGLDGAHNSG
jgi:hypothetical protein